jgi:putative transposase
MPRIARKAPGGQVYHVLNRAVGTIPLFADDADFEAFQRVMVEAHLRHPIRILAYCVLSNHWHFVVWPDSDGEVTDFFRWLAHTHAMRWRVAHRTVGYGHLYRGRFKSFPVQRDEHLLSVLRYVERNALGAGLVERAEDWRWGSLWARRRGDKSLKALLSPWPVERPRDWVARVNAPLSARELGRLRVSIERGRPFGGDEWIKRTARVLGLEHTVRPKGRPPKLKPPENRARN